MMTEEQKQALINDLQSEKLVLEKWRDDWNTRDKVNYQAIDIALVALTQPASPALKLPDLKAAEEVFKCLYSGRALSAAINAAKWYEEEAKRLNAPHTVPIEPICATGGVKVPEGWSLVPNEATREMIEEGDQWELSENIWNAMIGVAPKP